MALNSSGPISISGTTTGQSVAIELGSSSGIPITFNDTPVRALAAKPSGAISLADFYGKSSHVPLSSRLTFTANQSWTVPNGINTIRVKCWGGAGGGGSTGGNYPVGGGGGYVGADISVTPGNTLLIAVGGGGAYVTGVVAPGGVNGGGAGGGTVFAPGGGGGYSGVFRNNAASQINALAIAGGGGGAGAQFDYRGCGYGGGGGPTYYAALQGGQGLDGGKGGGGGGYVGGSGATDNNVSSGGAGGSNFVVGGSINVSSLVGSGKDFTGNPANKTDIDYVAGKGQGYARAYGGPGYVVIYY